jgi:hypothetical protein
MSNQIVSFNREFKLQTYMTSHGQLLLRSAKAKGCDTRLDILFKDVYAFHLGTSLIRLSIFEVSKGDLTEQFGDLTALEEPHVKWFLLQTSKWAGFVHAGGVAWKEDAGEFHEPSQLIPELLWPGLTNPGRGGLNVPP